MKINRQKTLYSLVLVLIIISAAGHSLRAADDPPISNLIDQLGDKDYYVRQHAQDELSRLGFEAFDALSAAAVSDDLEIASRAKYLLHLMRIEWTAKDDPPEVKKLLKEYELQTEDTRLIRMHALAILPDAKGILPLCRLVRFEKSDLLSKIAVIEVLQSPFGAEPPKGARAETIRKLFEKSTRSSAAWIVAWLRLADNPRAMEQWNKLVDTESELFRHSAADTNHEILNGLIRYQTTWLKKQGRTQEAVSSMRRMLDLEEKGDFETISELLEWFSEQKAWGLIDELAARFAPRFEAEPILLYGLAQAQKEQGNSEKAELTAKRAFAINPGREDLKLLNRHLVAQRLIRRGLSSWGKRELEYIIAQGGEYNRTAIDAQWTLAELFHDQGDDMAAANVLELLLKSADGNTNSATAGRIASTLQRFYSFRKKSADMATIDRTISEVRARMFFLQACHWEREGEKIKRRESLEKALAQEPGDVDVLIACYRLPDQTPEYQNKIKELIRRTTDDLRVEISAEPGNPSLYNQFAWLVGNTEGDLDEALKSAQKSLELSPDNGGLYDTLARVYYAKGDYDNALKHQQKAVELEPHSGLIARQLELIKKTRDEHKN
jgi:tetratricopeptide (TPR) repeat protein